VGLSLPIFAALSYLEPLLVWSNQSAVATEGAMAYLRAMRWGILPFLGYAALRSFFEGVSRPMPVTLISLVGVGLNVAANEVLMFGRLGAPALGLAGTGWASVLVFTCLFGMLALLAATRAPFAQYEVFARLRGPDPTYLRELLRIGAPMGASRGLESSLFTVTTAMMGTLGTAALAAHQVALQCAAFTFMVPLGIGMAGSVRVGRAAGAGDPTGVRRAGSVAMALATGVMGAAAAAFLLAPRALTSLYLDLSVPANQEVAALAATLLGIAAVFQLVDGLQVAAHGALQGLKDTRVPMGIAAVTYWGLGLPAGYLWGVRGGGGPEALWWGLVLGLTAAAVLMTGRFYRQAGALADDVDPSPASPAVPEAEPAGAPEE
jgi:MATE family multidrug resistance protein